METDVARVQEQTKLPFVFAQKPPPIKCRARSAHRWKHLQECRTQDVCKHSGYWLYDLRTRLRPLLNVRFFHRTTDLVSLFSLHQTHMSCTDLQLGASHGIERLHFFATTRMASTKRLREAHQHVPAAAESWSSQPREHLLHEQCRASSTTY